MNDISVIVSISLVPRSSLLFQGEILERFIDEWYDLGLLTDYTATSISLELVEKLIEGIQSWLNIKILESHPELTWQEVMCRAVHCHKSKTSLRKNLRDACVEMSKEYNLDIFHDSELDIISEVIVREIALRLGFKVRHHLQLHRAPSG